MATFSSWSLSYSWAEYEITLWNANISSTSTLQRDITVEELLKNLENTAEDVYEKAYDHVDNTTAKTKSFKDNTLEKTKHTLSEIADSLEQISNKLRKQD